MMLDYVNLVSPDGTGGYYVPESFADYLMTLPEFQGWTRSTEGAKGGTDKLSKALSDFPVIAHYLSRQT